MSFDIQNLEEPAEPDAEPTPPASLKEVESRAFLQRITFQWRPEDDRFLDRVKMTAADLFHELFKDAVEEIDRLYGCLRVPMVRQDGEVATDAQGRTLWEQANGKPIERFDQLRGSDVMHVLLSLERVKMSIAIDVNRLRNDAIYAKMVADDYEDDYRGDKGPQEERKVTGRRMAREDRYRAFYLYYLWSVANTFHKEIVDFIFRLRDVRTWQIQSE